MPGRKTYSGAATETSLDGGITSTATTLVLTDGSTYGAPTAGAPMVIVVGPGTATEEQILISARSGNTLTVAASGRNWHLGGSGTGVAHNNAEVVRHVLDADSIDDANRHVNTDADDDHSQYLNTTRHDVEARHAFGSALGTPGAAAAVGTGAASAGTGDDAAREDHVHNHNPPHCAVRHSGTQSHATTNTWKAMDFDTEDEDTATMHDNVTNNTRITVPVAGLYLFTGYVEFAANSAGVRALGLRKNGSGTDPPNIKGRAATSSPHASNAAGMGLSAPVKLAANDYVELVGFQNSGGALGVEQNTGEQHPYFTATWLGTG